MFLQALPRLLQMLLLCQQAEIQNSLLCYVQIVQVKDKILHTIIKYGWKAPGSSSQMCDDRPDDISHIFVLKTSSPHSLAGMHQCGLEFIVEPQGPAPGSFSVCEWMVKMKMMGVFPFIVVGVL